jgi:hypothetical protein
MPKYLTPRVPHETKVLTDAGHMTRPWIIFLERLGLHVITNNMAGEKKATFGLCRLLTVENDLTNHFICLVGGKFSYWAANAKNPGTGAAVILNIQISHDEGVTWNSIFDSVKIVIPDGDDSHIEGDVFTTTAEHAQILPGELLRINCEQFGSTYAGKDIEVVLRWE